MINKTLHGIVPEKLEKAVWESVLNERKVYPCHVNRASDIGHPCVRYLFFSRKRWEDRQLVDVGLQFIFNEGNMHEEAVFERLKRAGFKITETQRAFTDRKMNISGHIDGFISHCDLIQRPIPLEVKGLSSNNWASINSYDDMISHKQHYVRKYPAQLQMYMYLSETEVGLFVLKNKQTGQLKFIVVELDYDYVEEILKKIERVNKWCGGDAVPDETTEEIKICQSCAFNHLCFGDKEGLPGVVVMEDHAVEESLKKMEELKAPAAEYAGLKEEVAEAIKARAAKERDKEGKADIIVGDFVCSASRCNGTKYSIPKEVKEKYAEPNPYWKFNGYIKL